MEIYDRNMRINCFDRADSDSQFNLFKILNFRSAATIIRPIFGRLELFASRWWLAVLHIINFPPWKLYYWLCKMIHLHLTQFQKACLIFMRTIIIYSKQSCSSDFIRYFNYLLFCLLMSHSLGYAVKFAIVFPNQPELMCFMYSA